MGETSRRSTAGAKGCEAGPSLTLPKLPPNAPRLFPPDPKLVAGVEQLTRDAAEGDTGRADRTGDPTPEEKPQPRVPVEKDP